VQRLFRRDTATIATPGVTLTTNEVTVREAMSFERTFDGSKGVSVELCMITTPDGVTDVNGRSGPLGSDTDREVLLTLRDNADVVLVGGGTVRAENYGAPQRSPLPIVVVSKSCDFDWTSPLFASGWGMIATTASSPNVPVRSFRAGEDAVDLGAIIHALRSELGTRVIHIEGGPTLNGALLRTGLVDAINLTIAPHIGNGGTTISSRLVRHGFNNQRFQLAQLCRDDNHVFVRYERVR